MSCYGRHKYSPKKYIRLIDCCNTCKSLNWRFLLSNLNRLYFSSSISTFSSILYRGRNDTSSLRVPRDRLPNFFNLFKPRLYNVFVKPSDSLPKQESSNNLKDFLSTELPVHPDLIRGQLKNGLHYCILQHKFVPDRFDAHLEVHVGSVHEEDDEQGIAHMTEHVLLESYKLNQLLRIGMESGGYTRFYRTIYHVTSQTILEHFDEDLLDGELVGGDLVPHVLNALNEVAFEPKIRACHLERERHTVLSELQMCSTIVSRYKLKLFQHLHSENKLSKRSILGLEDQIKKWNIDQIKKFHKRWYFHGNATLYIVGDINDVSKTIESIQAVFGKSGRSLYDTTLPQSNIEDRISPTFIQYYNIIKSLNFSGLTFGKSKRSAHERASRISKNKGHDHPLRPLTTFHNWSLPRSNANNQKKPLQIFQHDLITSFCFQIISKIPVIKLQTYGDLRNFVMKGIYLSILRSRLKEKFESSNSSARLVNMDQRDDPDCGCAVIFLSTISEPKDWKTALKVAFHEVRKLKDLGINNDEFTIRKDVILKDSRKFLAPFANYSNRRIVKFIMFKDGLEQPIMEIREAHKILKDIATTITLEEVNSIGQNLLEFISDYGKPTAPIPSTIMVSAPSTQKLERELIESTIKQGLEELIYAEPEIEVPTELISSSQLHKLLLEHQPTFLYLLSSKSNVRKLHEKGTTFTQRRLSNGIAVNYKITDLLCGGVIQVIIGGGSACESLYLKGAILVGVQTLREGGCVGNFSKKQVEAFCLKNDVKYTWEVAEDYVSIRLRFFSIDNGMQAAFQLLHMLLEQSVWLEDAFDRARQSYLSKYDFTSDRLRQSTTDKLMLAMLDGDDRFVNPSQISLQNLTLQSVKDLVLNQLTTNNIEVSIIGQISEKDIESNIINYLGTIKATENLKNEHLQYDSNMHRGSPSHLESQVFLKDTEERTYACISGLTPNMWGFTIDGKQCLEFNEGGNLRTELHHHPLFFWVTMDFLTCIMNTNLDQDVVLSGLAYEADFNVRLLHKLNLGWYKISISSTPYKVHETVDTCKKVLKDFRSNTFIDQDYLEEVRGDMLMRHKDELKSNSYWLWLLTRLQDSSSPRKDITCIKDLESLYKLVSLEDVYFAYDQLKINADSMYSCIGLTV